MELKDIQICVTSNGYLVTPKIANDRLGQFMPVGDFATFESLPSLLEWLRDHFTGKAV